MELNENILKSDLQVDDIAAAHLRETAKWARFLAILGFIISILLALGGLFAGTFMSSISRMGDGTGPGIIGAGFITVIYIVIAAIYIMLSLYLYRFATKMLDTLQQPDQQVFNDSLNNLRLVYKITGIIVVIYLCFLALALIVGIGVTMMR